MTISLGPILYFNGATTDSWKVRVQVVASASPGSLTAMVPGQPSLAAAPLRVADFGTDALWRFDLDVPRQAQATTVVYRLAGNITASFVVPAVGAPPRMAYASCNGFSSEKEKKRVTDHNSLWRQLTGAHGAEPYNLLLLGGDQVYADSIWERVALLRHWLDLDDDRRCKAKFTDRMRAAVERFYRELYRSRWSQPEVARAFASIPSIMMWDDHDIFDGWGSHRPEQQASPVFRGIFLQARRCFQLLQLAGDAEDLTAVDPNDRDDAWLRCPPSLSYWHAVDQYAIAAIDMRSQRTGERVVNRTDWDAFFNWADALDTQSCRHLLVLSSIPVVHPDFGSIESLLGALPGQQELEDDLRDHWTSRPHREERLRLIQRLFRLGERGIRVTLLSGDVHVGAVGVLQKDRNRAADPYGSVINQLTSSAIVHPPPPGVVLYFLENVMAKEEAVDTGVSARMVELPGSRHRFMGGRNWMSLEPDPSERIWVKWFVEGEPDPYTKVVHACG